MRVAETGEPQIIIMSRESLKKCAHISGILAELLNKHRRESGGEMIRIRELWEDIVGVAIAQNAQPVAYQKKLLIVNVTSSVWTQQLQFLKEDILSRMREAAGDVLVDDIKFRVGSLSA
jgi:predicted nucleic acid-binding Zn ribbon protein